MAISSTKTTANLLLLLFHAVVFMSTLISSSLAYEFYVGDKDGWVQKPCETFNHWAEKQRFQIKDKLVFKYKNDSVLLVKKQSYDSCNITEPVKKLKDCGGGESEFRFKRAGPFYFISGETGHCKNGQKLVVVVMADRSNQGQSSPSPSPGPAGGGGPEQSTQSSSSSWSSTSSAFGGFLGAAAMSFGAVFML
ncbi:Early nodulin-like protein 1 [Platanthera guangdongensis]|uniref:Early nodulin-like protein 1 n=1 Tax=Platanthera guangdongensis TaxID=2320717 RepID=A0ABR2LZW2_9ASPA